MRVLFDTNIYIDAFIERGKNSVYARTLFVLVANKFIEAYVAPHTLSNIYYILRKAIPENKRRELISDICKFSEVVPVDNEIVLMALNESRISDFEDALQYACAKAINADCICTNDVNGFKGMDIMSVTAVELFDFPELP